MSRKTKDKRKRSAEKARRGFKQSQTKDDGLKTNSKGEWVATSKRGKQQLKWARKQIVAQRAKEASDEMDRREKLADEQAQEESQVTARPDPGAPESSES